MRNHGNCIRPLLASLIVFCVATPLPAFGGAAGGLRGERARQPRDHAARQETAGPRRAGSKDDAGTQGERGVGAYAGVFSSVDPISVPSFGSAALYPSNIPVSGLSGKVVSVKVTLNGVQHANAEDLDIALLGPHGQTALLMSDAGGSTALSDAAITFDDNAVAALPAAREIISGTYHPTNHIGTFGPEPDWFDAPGLSTPQPSSLSDAFAGTDPNGTWRLLVTDDRAGNLGGVAGGWALEIVTAEPSVFENAGGITTSGSGSSNPYPSPIVVSGLSGKVGRVTAALENLSHPNSYDLEVLLVGPEGQSTILMQHVHAGSIAGGVYTFEDAFPSLSDTMPAYGPIPSGTYGPSRYSPNTDNWAWPAPAGPRGTRLRDFNGTDPNGTWSLYVADVGGAPAGSLGGWSLSFTMVPDAPACSPLAVSPAPLPGGTKGTAYTQRMSLSGGTAPVDWSVPSGLLPNGLVLDADTGTISGTPSAQGAFTFDVVATDAFGCSGTASYSVTIASASTITLSPTSLPAAPVFVAHDARRRVLRR